MLHCMRCRHQSAIKVGRALSNASSSSEGSNNNYHHNKRNHSGKAVSAVIAGTLFTAGFLYNNCEWKKYFKTFNGAAYASSPQYSSAEVSKHKRKEDGIWVSYKGKVYDITSFVDNHPGGNKILLAAGGSLEPFWALYAVHQSEEVYKMLEEYEIGTLVDEPASKGDLSADPFALEPRRHPALKVVSPKPFNAETSPDLLTDNLYTPNDLFFVRNHLPVPEVDPKTYRLEISGNNKQTVKISLSELKKLPKKTISATVMCAGNRRSDMHAYRPVKGLGWEGTAISNATWTGVLLTDLLKAMKIKDLNCKHVQFSGLDHDITGATYGASLPSECVLDPRSEILIAYEMNGQELPRDHGYPVRLVAPGMVGARQVKWLSKITLSDEESQSHWQQNDYKTFSPSVDWDTIDYSKSPPINEPPVNSAICVPKPGAVLEDEDSIEVEGYAWSGGGRGIIRVEISIDDGATWHLAELQQVDQPLRQQWSWTLWKAEIPLKDLKKGSNDVKIICKAVDSSQSTQPESYRGTWNVRGLVANAWHRVPITVKRNE